jgi:cation diffusion facilitator CzcD-associated flavoprotein CzcO
MTSPSSVPSTDSERAVDGATVDGAAVDGAAVDVAAVVIGAGQAGLSAAYHLRRLGLRPGKDFVVLDANVAPGGAWQHRWGSLKLGKTHRIYQLPGMPVPQYDPNRPAAEVIPDYFAGYERAFGLGVRRPVPVRRVVRGHERLIVTASTGDSGTGMWAAEFVINATGTWTAPFWPHYPGQESFTGRQLHTADYRDAGEFAGQRVLVVGGGNSAVQLIAELYPVAQTTWVTRRVPVWHEGAFDEDAGRQAVARVIDAVAAGRPPTSVVSVTGLGVTPEVAAARAAGALERQPMFARITPTGVEWDDGRSLAVDVILWCTGFRAALDHLAALHLREPGGGIKLIGTRAAREPRLHLVGYGPSASTIGANRAGRAAAHDVVSALHAGSGASGRVRINRPPHSAASWSHKDFYPSAVT